MALDLTPVEVRVVGSLLEKGSDRAGAEVSATTARGSSLTIAAMAVFLWVLMLMPAA